MIPKYTNVILYKYMDIFTDKDECKPTPKGKPKCDDNSRCVNKMGGFECVCCAGFKKADNGSCVGKCFICIQRSGIDKQNDRE